MKMQSEGVGVYPRWHDPAKNQGELEEWLGREFSRESRHDKPLRFWHQFLDGTEKRLGAAKIGFDDLSGWYLKCGIADLYRNGANSWAALSHAAVYRYWETRIGLAWAEQEGWEKADTRSPGFNRSGLNIALLIALGQYELAIDQARRMYERPHLLLGQEIDGRFGRFVLRLVAQLEGWPEPVFPKERFPTKTFDVPLNDELRSTWDITDLTRLSGVWLAACDWHTHQSREANNKEYFDFDGLEWACFPVEILMLMRLRERAGLPNPELDHPLMNSPLGKLPPPQPVWSDELMESVLQRVREQLPQL